MCSRSSGFGIGYGIGQKYPPIWVLVSVSDLNQNSGFGRTLCCIVIGLATWYMQYLLQYRDAHFDPWSILIKKSKILRSYLPLCGGAHCTAH